jgi:uncharacterized protein (DUF3820 family)
VLEDFERDSRKELLELANARMPFGKYEGKLLIELPENYLVWYQSKGFPKGKLGNQLAQMMEIKLNGLEKLIYPLIVRK